ncbi:MAG: hypothetical protein J1E63_10295, partial [Muribaculaceae bacterium]|nr:hypothetical protein [Muribaculaceae bacterium]
IDKPTATERGAGAPRHGQGRQKRTSTVSPIDKPTATEQGAGAPHHDIGDPAMVERASMAATTATRENEGPEPLRHDMSGDKKQPAARTGGGVGIFLLFLQ